VHYEAFAARRLATAKRSCVSMRVTKSFSQGKGRGRPCGNFPHIQFYRGKFGCLFSCCVREIGKYV